MIRRLLTTLTLSALLATSTHAAPGAKGPHPRDFDRKSDKKASVRGMEDATLDRWQKFQNEKSILDRLEISRDQMKSLVREFKANPAEYASLQRLIKSAHTSRHHEDTSLLKGYFQLLSHAAGEFHLSPSRLEERMQNWAPVAKENLAQVLHGSAQLAREGKSVTREHAFQLALKKLGLDAQYQNKCRRG